MGGAGVEVAGRLVGQDNFGAVHDGAGDGDALLLAAGKLGGEEVFAVFKMKTVESFGGFFQTTGLFESGVEEGEGNVFEDGEVAD